MPTSILFLLALDYVTGAALSPLRRLNINELQATNFVAYPGYAGNLAVGGTVSVTTAGTTQTIEMAFSGLDAACASGAGTAANSCGVHIHSGKTCSDATLVGGHYFTGGVTIDPWTSVAYTSADGTLTATFSVETGGAASDVLGRAFVVHGYDGGRIGCALLLDPSLQSVSPPSAPPPSPTSPSLPRSTDDDDGSWWQGLGEDLKDWQRIAILSAAAVIPTFVLLVAVCCCRRRCRNKPVLAGHMSA